MRVVGPACAAAAGACDDADVAHNTPAIKIPAIKDADYSVANILAESFPPTEVNALYEKYRDAYASGQNILNLGLISDFGAPLAAAAAAAAPAATTPPAADTPPAR